MILILLFISILNIFICPHTKVEESFNIQATHDLLNLKLNSSKFDHLKFPGVVPRTFTAPLLISTLSFPFIYINSILNFPKNYQQYFVRGVIGSLTVLGHYIYADALRKSCGKSTSFYYVILTISQFHINFYASRSLPNTFALILSLFSISFYLRRKFSCFVISSGVAVLLIRSELSILFGIMILPILISKGVKTAKVFIVGVITAAVILVVSIPIDSYFWCRMVWPEFEVLWFNTVLNRSSLWGTHHFLWYFYSAVPRCLMTSLVLVVGNLLFNYKSKTTEMSIYALLFIFIYSFLPHKEVRFIIYVVPILNGAAAHLWQLLSDNSRKVFCCKIIHRLLWLLLILNVAATSFLLTVSHYNYPGGEAISFLNSQENLSSKNIHVHICNLAAQTGVTRFHEVHDHWIYNKTENIDDKSSEMFLFTHVILESNTLNHFRSMMKDHEYKVLFEVYSFAGISLHWPFYRLKSSISILEKIVF